MVRFASFRLHEVGSAWSSSIWAAWVDGRPAGTRGFGQPGSTRTAMKGSAGAGGAVQVGACWAGLGVKQRACRRNERGRVRWVVRRERGSGESSGRRSGVTQVRVASVTRCSVLLGQSRFRRRGVIAVVRSRVRSRVRSAGTGWVRTGQNRSWLHGSMLVLPVRGDSAGQLRSRLLESIASPRNDRSSRSHTRRRRRCVIQPGQRRLCRLWVVVRPVRVGFGFVRWCGAVVIWAGLGLDHESGRGSLSTGP